MIGTGNTLAGVYLASAEDILRAGYDAAMRHIYEVHERTQAPRRPEPVKPRPALTLAAVRQS